MTETRKRFDIPTNLPELREGLAAGRERLREVEAQAEDVLKTLYTRGNEELKARVPEPWMERARAVETDAREQVEGLLEDLGRRATRLQAGLGDRLRTVMGVAGTGDVESLHRELRRLSKKIDRLAEASGARTAKPRTSSRTTKGAGSKTTAKTQKGDATSRNGASARKKTS